MSNDRVKIYKNPAREVEDEHKPYVPQYQMLGKHPGEIGMLIANQLPLDNPRASKPVIRQSFDLKSQNNNELPNVGNNMENIWSSIDGEFDDYELDPSHPIIDNNEVVDLGYQDKVKFSESVEQNNNDLLMTLESLKENDYLLLVNGVPVCTGCLEKVQKEASDLLFGDHTLCDGKAVPIEDIIVLKKSQIKVGLFLE